MKILLRLSSELTMKSDQVRAKFVSRMLRNMQAAFAAAGIEASVEREWSRLFVTTADERALDVLGRIFGLSSYSRVDRECGGLDPDAIVRAGVETYADAVRGKSFAVRVKRTGKHPYSSVELAGKLGAALAPFARAVDLDRPEVEVSVEVRHDGSYLHCRRERGAGGLPLGVNGRALVLLSGGFDSAVAAWAMQKRGVEVDYLFCNLAGAAYERSVLAVAKHLQAAWAHGSRTSLHIVDFQPMVAHIRAKVRPSFAQVILKRQLYRAAGHVARRSSAAAVITGECIGQVASQTLPNLVAIDAASDLPVLRPVIGYDKEEIMALARRIGVFDLCAAVQEYCQLVPEKPVVAVKPSRLDEEEAYIDAAVLDACLASHRILYLPKLGAQDLRGDYVYADAIPPGAVVIDTREAEQFAAWHHPGSIHCELHDLLLSFRRLDKARTYLLYCPVGLQSAVAAEAMQNAGWQAYSLRGGMRSLAGPPLA